VPPTSSKAVDHYYDLNYKNQCETVYKSFEVEFGSRFIGLLFHNAIMSTRMMVINSQLGVSQARRELDGDNDFAKASIAALEKIYRIEARIDHRSFTSLALAGSSLTMAATCARQSSSALPFLPSKIVALINANDASERSADVVEDLLNHWKPDTQSGHARSSGAPEIVNRPILDAAELVEALFEPAKIDDWSAVEAKDILLAVARQRLDQRDRLRAEGEFVGTIVFDAFTRQANQPLVEVNFVPNQTGDLATPLAGQDQDTDQRAVNAHLLGSPPDRTQLLVGQNPVT
jgi:hypothetical protein